MKSTAATRAIRILLIEDQIADAELILRELSRAGFAPDWRRVETKADYLAHLDSGLDAILADYNLPGFDGLEALQLLEERGLDIPFILVSGTIGEETAVQAMQLGADDYVLKDRMARLGSAVQRAIVQKQLREERRKAELQLRESEERYRDLFENAHDLIQSLAPDGCFLYVNRAWRETLGYSHEEVAKLTFSQVLHPDGRDHAEELLREAWAGEPLKLVQLDLRSKAGERIIVEGGISTKLVDGKAVSLRGIFSDVTEKIRLETQILRNQRMESIGTLAGGIAHDLNNALAPILMAIELLRTKFTDPDSIALLETLAGSAQRGADMVRQVLTFARGLEGKQAEVQLKHLTSEMQKIIRRTFPKNIQVRTNIGKDLWTVTGDTTQLHQVLLNLCVNARDAMPAGGTLAIEAENVSIDQLPLRSNPEAKPGPHVMLQVADTGSGIAPDIRDRIFEPFFTTKPPGQGTGLGLSTVRGIVKSHGGFISVSSELGKGSQFRVYLPADAVGAKSRTESHAAPAPGRGELILVVDDEHSIRTIAEQTLVMFGYRVLTAHDGAQAVAVCHTSPEKIHLVVIDSVMPVMDGPAAIRALRTLQPAMRIIAASGLPLEIGRTDPPKFQPEAILQKPYTAQELLTLVRDVLDRPAPI